jgi:hypothetical protein
MSKKIGGVVALVSLCALSLFLLNCGSSSSRPSGVLYVLTEGNNNIGNNVSSFELDLGTGSLSLVNSNASTCPTTATQGNPEPCGLPLDILLDPTGATAFVLDQGAPPCPSCSSMSPNTPIAPAIYPYTINSDGSLSSPGTAVNWICPGANTACNYSDTAEAMVRDSGGQFLFVIDYGSYPTPGYPTPTLTSPSCPHVPTGPFDVCPSISVFAMKPGSTTLTLASGSPFYLSKIPSSLSPITFTPPGSTTAQELLFVTNNLDVCTQNCISPSPHNDSTVSIYSVSPTGVLSEKPNSPYAVAASDPVSVQAVETNPNQSTGGVFVYVGQGAGVGALYPFQVCFVPNANCSAQDVAGNLMVPLSTCQSLSCNVPPSSVGSNPAAMLVDPTNNFLYVMSSGQNEVSGFKINTTAGSLTSLNPPNLPTGSQPVSMAMHAAVNSVGQGLYSSSGQFLYTSNTTSSNISGFTLSTTTGSMTEPFTVVAPAVPSGMAAH